MADVGYAASFRDLRVYRLSRSVAQEIFKVTKAFPREEAYSLTDQARRSSRSVGAQIAEAWAKRRYENHFISKLTDADAELQETQHWIETAVDCGYLGDDVAELLLSELHRIGRMLHSMIDKAPDFCGKPSTLIREDTKEYFT